MDKTVFDPSFFKLTDYEKTMLNSNKCGDSLVMVVAFLENQIEAHQISETIVCKALSFLQRRHPYLRSHLDENLNLVIKTENYDPIEFQWSDKKIEREQLIKDLEEFNTLMFDFNSKSNLARCKAASFIDSTGKKMFSLSLLIPMVITDGINITAILIELVNIVNALLTNTECDEMKTVLEPSPSLHYLTEKYNMVGSFAKALIKISDFLIKFLNPVFLLSDEFKKYNESGFKLNLNKLNADLTTKILQKAKQNKVKLTGFLSTAIFYALKDLYLENGLKLPKELICALPANLRMRYKPEMSFSDLRAQVCISATIMKKSRFKFNNIWQDSKYVHHEIEKMTDLKIGTMFLFTHSSKHLKHSIKLFETSKNVQNACEVMNKESVCDLVLSNIGSYVWNKNMVYAGPLKITESYFSDSLQSKPNILPGLIFHIGFWDGQIMIQLSSNKYVIGSVFVDRLMILFEEHLKKSVHE